jgi:hypothetical protein
MVSASLLLSDQLTQLAHYLGGEFDNRQQSLRDPVWYLHLRLWLRPLPRSLFDQGHSFFIEQISVAAATPLPSAGPTSGPERWGPMGPVLWTTRSPGLAR